eukprot:TRINITY_DN1633_c0_g1_i1.p1 TRINITY_DN1633_c0_g1~~TRINITY_DN1633_c0_g1_i1.p1  ORF type:complete len:122 (+),score=19.75 TRINITY_DN1633_c0_g1_i1:81-446(+)
MARKRKHSSSSSEEEHSRSTSRSYKRSKIEYYASDESYTTSDMSDDSVDGPSTRELPTEYEQIRPLPVKGTSTRKTGKKKNTKITEKKLTTGPKSELTEVWFLSAIVLMLFMALLILSVCG